MTRSDVLIIGAGPTGLVLALWLSKLGVKPRIIDKTAAPGTTSRALAVHARTLELYRQLDLAHVVVERGHKVPAVQLWVNGKPRTRIDFQQIASGVTPYSFLEIFPQDEHERLLAARLEELGVSVERQTELVSYRDEGDRIVAHLRRSDGREETCEADYIAGCDGVHSIVRETMGTGFPGGTYRQLFYVADVQARGPAIDGELHVDLEEADFLAVFPLAGSGRARLIGTVRDERAGHADTLKFEDVSRRIIENLKVEVQQVNWFSTYRVHHRVTAHFRKGRAFLLGDAAHIHSPVGAQGMNTGLQDAYNLAWKLALVVAGRADATLLDSYEQERIPVARRLLNTTDRAFRLIVAVNWLAGLLRTKIIARIAGLAMSRARIQRFAFRVVSQIGIEYRESALSQTMDDLPQGAPRAGDRFPWLHLRLGTDGVVEDVFQKLDDAGFNLIVVGQPSPAAAELGLGDLLRVHVVPDDPGNRAELARAEVPRTSFYLLRPDGHIGLCGVHADSAAIRRYAFERLHVGTASA
jgi:2-polyprenyl-6-methoxyphenol hydroxylase-like FAD-dependent oxidoreductase